jgi:hypothetical protein
MTIAQMTKASLGNPPYDNLSLSLQIPSDVGEYYKTEITTKFGLGACYGKDGKMVNYQVILKNLTDNLLIGEQAACNGWVNDPEHTLPYLGHSTAMVQGMWGRVYGNPSEEKNPYTDWDFWLCSGKHVMFENHVGDYIQASIAAMESGQNQQRLSIFMKLETFFI